MKSWHKHALILGCLFAASVAVYQPSLPGRFTNWDDQVLVAENPAIRSLSPDSVARLFASSNRGAYLPVRVLSYALDYSLWGRNPLGYRLGNLLLHSLNAFLAYLLIFRVFPRREAAVVGALFFLVHPAQVESVAWISGRKEVLCGFFLLLSALCFLSHRERQARRTYVFSLVFFVLACLSKASAIVLPVLLLAACLLDRGSAPGRMRGLPRTLGPFFLVALVVFIINFAVGNAHGVVKGLPSGGIAATFLTAGRAVADYAQAVLFPVGLSAKYLVPIARSPLDPRFLSAAGLILAAAFLIVVSRSRMALLGGAWFLVALLPYLNIIPISTLRADRYLYVALLGAALVAASALEAVRPAWLRWPLAVILLSCLALLSWQRAHIWVDSRALWRDTVAKCPLSPTAQSNLGSAYLLRGRRGMAETQFQRALACDPSFCPALTDLSIMWREGGKRQEALRAGLRAVTADPSSPEARLNLGLLQAEQGDLAAAYLTFGEAVNLDPALPEAYYNMGGVRLLQKRLDEAMALYEKAIAAQPDFVDAHLKIGIVYMQLKSPESAISSFQRACQLQPDNPEAFYDLAQAYLARSQDDLAEAAAARALQLGFPPAKDLLAKIRSQKIPPVK